MSKKIEGQVYKLGRNVDIAQAFLGNVLNDELQNISFSLSDENVEFPLRLRRGDIIIFDKCFGHECWDGRIMHTLKSAGIGCVIADCFSRSFYRQGISRGLMLLECDEAFKKISTGEIISIDMERHEISCMKGIIKFKPLPEIISKIIQSGGIIAHTRKSLGK